MKFIDFIKKNYIYGIILLLIIGIIVAICLIYNFNPFVWIGNHWKVIGSVAIVIVAVGVGVFAQWLHYRKRG